MVRSANVAVCHFPLASRVPARLMTRQAASLNAPLCGWRYSFSGDDMGRASRATAAFRLIIARSCIPPTPIYPIAGIRRRRALARSTTDHMPMRRRMPARRSAFSAPGPRSQPGAQKVSGRSSPARAIICAPSRTRRSIDDSSRLRNSATPGANSSPRNRRDQCPRYGRRVRCSYPWRTIWSPAASRFRRRSRNDGHESSGYRSCQLGTTLSATRSIPAAASASSCARISFSNGGATSCSDTINGRVLDERPTVRVHCSSLFTGERINLR